MQQFQISIPVPCHQSWDKMTPLHQGRFCNSCAKAVVDFTMMTDTEVLDFFSNKKSENICGRALPSQLDNAIFFPKKHGRRKYWYWKYITMLFLFFGKLNGSKGQTKGEIRAKSVNVQTPSLKMKKPAKPATVKKQVFDLIKSIGIDGKIINEDGIPVSFATVQIKNLNISIVTDENGKFSLEIPAYNFIVDISAVGYLQKKVAIYNDNTAAIFILTKDQVILNEIVISTTICSKTTGISGGVSFGKVTVAHKNITGSVKTSINKNIISPKISPNPVNAGNPITLSANLKLAGKYNIQIIDATGKLVAYQEIEISSKQFFQNFPTDKRWSSGIYYLTICNTKKEKIYTNNFIVQ